MQTIKRMLTFCLFVCLPAAYLGSQLLTYMISPQQYAHTVVEGEVSVARDLGNYSFCVRVKAPFLLDDAACQPIALSYRDRNEGAQLMTITTGKSNLNNKPHVNVLKVWTKECPEVHHRTRQLRCDGVWRTVCVQVIKDVEIAVTVWRVDEESIQESTTRPCIQPLSSSLPNILYKYSTPVIRSGGKFTFNTVHVEGSATLKSDSKIKDVVLWSESFNAGTDYVKAIAKGDPKLIPQKRQIAWVFNSRSSLMQSGPVTVEEYPYGKGMVASPDSQLLEVGEKAVLTCQVVLNDSPGQKGSDNNEFGIRWFHQNSSADKISKLRAEQGHAHEVKRTMDRGDMSIYTLEQSTEDPFTEGWYYCQRDRIKGVETMYKSNIVHVTIADKVCKSFTRKDDKYGTLDFAAAIPGNYSVAKCQGGEARLLCTAKSTWDVRNSKYTCNTLIYSTLLEIINGSTASRIASLSEINSRSFEKMTDKDFDLVPQVVRRLAKRLYDKEGFIELLEWVGDLTEIPARVPTNVRQKFPVLVEELVEGLASHTLNDLIHLEHFSILVRKQIDRSSQIRVSDRTRPDVKIAVTRSADHLIAIYYRDTSWFRKYEHDHEVVINSPVVGIKIANRTALPVTILFNKNYSSANKSRCVYWDLTTEYWRSDNCTTKELSDGRVECKCDHLTSFAVLMEPFIEDPRNPFQTILSKVCLSVSIVFLGLSLTIWLSFKSIRSQMYIKVRCSFVVCLALAFLFFLTAGESSPQSGACYGLIFLMHWLFLATFGWMAVDAYWLRVKVVHSLDSYGVVTEHFLIKACLLAIGGSLVFPIVNVVIATIMESPNAYLTTDICWLNKDYQTYFLLLPIYAALSYNIWTFCQVAGIIFTVNKLAQSATTSFKKQLRSVLSVALSLGCTWVTAPLLLLPNKDMQSVIEIVFIVTTGLQGPFIFIFFVILQPDVKTALLSAIKSRRRFSDDSNASLDTVSHEHIEMVQHKHQGSTEKDV